MIDDEQNELPPSISERALPSLDEFLQNKSSSQGQSISIPKISVSETPVKVDVQRERTRTYLAGGLLALLGISLFGIGLYIILDTIFPRDASQEKKAMHRELITIVWTSQVTLVSGTLGFYFASERANNNSDK